MSTEETQPVSGSRPEQEPDDPTHQPGQQQPWVPAPAYAPAPPPRRRGRMLLAAGAVGAALVAGTGGFALGHAAAGDDRDGRFAFTRHGGPMGGPQGTIPGQPPGGFADRDRDGDGDGVLPD